MYKNEGFLSEDLVIEELIPHNFDQLIKIHTIGDHAMFWRIDQSIPEGFFSENAFIIHKSDVETKLQEHQSKCSIIEEEFESETSFDIRFLKKVTDSLVRAFGVAFLGFDFVVNQKDDSL
jgi:hypothetical protein